MKKPDPHRDADKPHYRAFVSYSHADTRWARWLVRVLETWRVPPRLTGRETPMGPVPQRLTPIFRDRDELAVSAELGEHIQRALEDSEALLVICSPAAARSRWVNEEVLSFKRLGRQDRIFGLIVAGDPAAGDGPEQCFPPALRFRIGADGQLTDQVVETAAADVRPGCDGRRRAALKIRAGLLGVDYDELAQREQQRRNRRLAGLTAASVAGMLLTGYLAVTAMIARDDADRSRERAEDLIGFMLGDLTDSLQAVGRLELFDAIGDEALSYFESLDSREVSSRTLAQRADAMTLIGETAMDQGQFADAVRAFSQSVEHAQRLLELDPDASSWQRQLSDSQLWLGAAYWQQGQLDDALEHFQLSMAAADSALELEPESIAAMSAAAGARNNIAQVLERRDELAAARQQYEAVLELQQRILAGEPDSADSRIELGFAHNALGQVDLRLGQLDAALEHYAQDLAIKRQVAAGEPDHALWQYYLALSEHNMAALTELAGEIAASSDHAERAVALCEELVEREPDIGPRQRLLGRATNQRGRLARMSGDLDRSLASLQLARGILGTLRAKQPDDVPAQRALAESRLAVAETLAAMGQVDAAISEALAGLGLYESLAASDPENIRARMNLARAEVAAGELHARNGDAVGARERFQSALRRLETLSPQSRDPAVLRTRAAALIGLGDIEAARPDVRYLLEAGYRQPDFMALIEFHGLRPTS